MKKQHQLLLDEQPLCYPFIDHQYLQIAYPQEGEKRVEDTFNQLNNFFKFNTCTYIDKYT